MLEKETVKNLYTSAKEVLQQYFNDNVAYIDHDIVEIIPEQIKTEVLSSSQQSFYANRWELENLAPDNVHDGIRYLCEINQHYFSYITWNNEKNCPIEVSIGLEHVTNPVNQLLFIDLLNPLEIFF